MSAETEKPICSMCKYFMRLTSQSEIGDTLCRRGPVIRNGSTECDYRASYTLATVTTTDTPPARI